MLQHDLIVVRNEFIRIVPETHQGETYVHYKMKNFPKTRIISIRNQNTAAIWSANTQSNHMQSYHNAEPI